MGVKGFLYDIIDAPCYNEVLQAQASLVLSMFNSVSTLTMVEADQLVKKQLRPLASNNPVSASWFTHSLN